MPASRSLPRELLHLAWPVLVGQAAVMGNGVIDTLMAGRLSPVDLAAVGIGASIYITVIMALMGVLLALTPVVAHHYGARRYAEAYLASLDVVRKLELEVLMRRVVAHPSGAGIPIAAIGIDSGDGQTSEAVYDFVRKHDRRDRPVIATKGAPDNVGRIEIWTKPKAIDPDRRSTKASRAGVQAPRSWASQGLRCRMRSSGRWACREVVAGIATHRSAIPHLNVGIPRIGISTGKTQIDTQFEKTGAFAANRYQNNHL